MRACARVCISCTVTMRLYICLPKCMCMRMYAIITETCICMWNICICPFVCVFVRMYVCMHICLCTLKKIITITLTYIYTYFDKFVWFFCQLFDSKILLKLSPSGSSMWCYISGPVCVVFIFKPIYTYMTTCKLHIEILELILNISIAICFMSSKVHAIK